MDMISEHFYNYDTHFDLAQAKQVPNEKDEPLVDWMRRPANHIRLKYEEYQEYLARIPALKQKPVPIALDEYAYTFGGSYKVVPAYAWTFHEMFRHAEVYQLGALTFITSTYSAANGQAVLNPTGMVFKLYRDRFGTIPVEVTGNSPQPKPNYPPAASSRPSTPAATRSRWTWPPRGRRTARLSRSPSSTRRRPRRRWPSRSAARRSPARARCAAWPRRASPPRSSSARSPA